MCVTTRAMPWADLWMPLRGGGKQRNIKTGASGLCDRRPSAPRRSRGCSRHRPLERWIPDEHLRLRRCSDAKVVEMTAIVRKVADGRQPGMSTPQLQRLDRPPNDTVTHRFLGTETGTRLVLAPIRRFGRNGLMPRTASVARGGFVYHGAPRSSGVDRVRPRKKLFRTKYLLPRSDPNGARIAHKARSLNNL